MSGEQAAVAIGVAQTCPIPGDVSANVTDHVALAQVAAERGARLLLFAELSLTGYELECAARIAMTPSEPRLVPLREAATALGITLVVGAPLRVDAATHIASLIFDPTGGVSAYTKRHLGAFGEGARVDGELPPPERHFFAPGSLDPMIEIEGMHAGLAICADTARPSHVAEAARRGANAYLASAFVIRSDFDHDAARLERYAREHSMIVALANFGAPSGGLAASGRSSIWSASGQRVVQLPPVGRGVAIATPAGGAWRGEQIALEV